MAFLAANESYNGCTISIIGSEYRELESGVERHKRDVMGNDPRFDMTPDRVEAMDASIFRPIQRLSNKLTISRQYFHTCVQVVSREKYYSQA